MIHLDTNSLINLHMPKSTVRAWLTDRLKTGEKVGCSVVVWAEYLCGPLTSREMELSRRLIQDSLVDLDEYAAELGAQLYNATGRRRGSFADCLIAATAIQWGANFVTLNRDDFSVFELQGLKLVHF